MSSCVGEDQRHSRSTKTLTNKVGSHASPEIQQLGTPGGLAGHSPFRSEAAEPNKLAVVDDRVVAVASLRLHQKLVPIVWFAVVHRELAGVPPRGGDDGLLWREGPDMESGFRRRDGSAS